MESHLTHRCSGIIEIFLHECRHFAARQFTNL